MLVVREAVCPWKRRMSRQHGCSKSSPEEKGPRGGPIVAGDTCQPAKWVSFLTICRSSAAILKLQSNACASAQAMQSLYNGDTPASSSHLWNKFSSRESMSRSWFYASSPQENIFDAGNTTLRSIIDVSFTMKPHIWTDHIAQNAVWMSMGQIVPWAVVLVIPAGGSPLPMCPIARAIAEIACRCRHQGDLHDLWVPQATGNQISQCTSYAGGYDSQMLISNLGIKIFTSGVLACRQKTIGRKTECGCGRGTGFWCGSCLSTRMGQNIDEVFRMPDWKCPSCLEICNCSGRTCDRHMAGLGCTRILSGEARDQGYKSVSVLILARLAC